MKKTKLIALTMVVALMMVGAGYAAWTDSTQVQGIVNTGNLDVYFVDRDNNLEVETDANMSGSIKYEKLGNEVNNKAIVTVNDVYPGSEFTVNLQILNNGTMPVKLDQGSVQDVINAWGILSPYITCNMTLGNGNSINPINTPINPDDVLNISFEFKVPIELNETTLPENSSYSATINPVFEQFNVQ